MTIKVEQEALLRVLESQHSYPLSEGSIQGKEGFVLVDFHKPLSSDAYSVDKLRLSTSDDDDDSIFTLSTASLSDTSDTFSELDRRVSFSEDLVTEVWTRPYTAKEEISCLFYTSEQTNRFRQEYRSERKLLNDLSIDPDTFPVDNDEFSALVASTTEQPNNERHRISRVVILHNDKLETFFNPGECKKKKLPSGDDFFDNESFWSGSITWY